MKTILVFSIFFWSMALPALGELTDADLDKIRSIVKEEIKAEIAASEKRTREYIDLKIETVNTKIDAINTRIDTLEKSIDGRFDALNTRMDDVDSRFDRIWLAIIALITAAIALPQLIILYAERKRGREIQTLIQQLRDKNETTPPSS